jgi:hypothetical protein
VLTHCEPFLEALFEPATLRTSAVGLM